MPTSKPRKKLSLGVVKSVARRTASTKRPSTKVGKGRRPSTEEAIRAELNTIVDKPDLWLDSPNPLFGGRTPGELIGTEDENLLREWIGSVKHGMFT